MIEGNFAEKLFTKYISARKTFLDKITSLFCRKFDFEIGDFPMVKIVDRIFLIENFEIFDIFEISIFSQKYFSKKVFGRKKLFELFFSMKMFTK